MIPTAEHPGWPSELRMLQRCILALHPGCDPHCVLDNGRVWGFCPAKLLCRNGEISEEEIANAIRQLPVSEARARYIEEMGSPVV